MSALTHTVAILFIALCCLSGAALAASPAEQAAAQAFQAEPLPAAAAVPANYRQLVEAYMRPALKDPSSAKMSFPASAAHAPCVVLHLRRTLVKGQCGSYLLNLKSSSGSYTGELKRVYVIEGGRVLLEDSVSNVQVRPALP